MPTPSARNDYRGSSAEWLHKHECDECRSASPVQLEPGYVVTACGAVWGSGKTHGRAFRRLSSVNGRDGYLWVQIRRSGRNAKVCIHRAVATAYLVKPAGTEVRHLDGNNHNNALSNLRWGTRKENADDRERHGRTAYGERNGYSRHSDADVAEAVSLLAAGANQREVAAKFSCSQATVWRWFHGQCRA